MVSSVVGDVMYVADYGNHRIQKLTTEGRFLTAFGKDRTGQKLINRPCGVIVDKNNAVIVSDMRNKIFNQNIDHRWQ